jgi:hypothetical protein
MNMNNNIIIFNNKKININLLYLNNHVQILLLNINKLMIYIDLININRMLRNLILFFKCFIKLFNILLLQKLLKTLFNQDKNLFIIIKNNAKNLNGNI